MRMLMKLCNKIYIGNNNNTCYLQIDVNFQLICYEKCKKCKECKKCKIMFIINLFNDLAYCGFYN